MRTVSWPSRCSSSMICVVLGIVLEAAAGIDHAGDAETIQLAHEMARGVLLVLRRQLRPLASVA